MKKETPLSLKIGKVNDIMYQLVKHLIRNGGEKYLDKETYDNLMYILIGIELYTENEECLIVYQGKRSIR